MEIVVTREYLISLLQAWQDGRITANEVLFTASKLLWGMKVLDDEEKEGGFSITAEVVDALDSLDINLITPEDVDAYIEFLKTPKGNSQEGSKKLWESHRSKIDMEARKAQLKNIKPYSNIFGKEPF